MKKINRPELKYYRKKLRTQSTFAEVHLWTYLKSKQVKRLRFRRQYSMENFIIDFYCPQIKLGIELDGEGHVYSEEYDTCRDNKLKSEGITILRYENSMALEHPDVIIKEIENFYENWKEINKYYI